MPSHQRIAQRITIVQIPVSQLSVLSDELGNRQKLSVFGNPATRKILFTRLPLTPDTKPLQTGERKSFRRQELLIVA